MTLDTMMCELTSLPGLAPWRLRKYHHGDHYPCEDIFHTSCVSILSFYHTILARYCPHTSVRDLDTLAPGNSKAGKLSCIWQIDVG